MTSSVFLTVEGGAGCVTSLIALPYIREHTIDDSATVKHGEAVFTHSSPRSSAPGTDRGTPAAIGSTSPGASALYNRVQVRDCAQPCNSADVYRCEGVLNHLSTGPSSNDGSTVTLKIQQDVN